MGRTFAGWSGRGTKGPHGQVAAMRKGWVRQRLGRRPHPADQRRSFTSLLILQSNHFRWVERFLELFWPSGSSEGEGKWGHFRGAFDPTASTWLR